MKHDEIDYPANKPLVLQAIQQGSHFLAGWSSLSTFGTSASPNKEVRLALMRHLKNGLAIKVEWGFKTPKTTADLTGWKISIKANVFGRAPQIVYYCFEAPTPAALQAPHQPGESISRAGATTHNSHRIQP